MLIEFRAKVNPWTVWLVGGELVIVGACLAAGFVAGWTVQTLAIIAPTGATAAVAWPAAVAGIRKAVERREPGEPGGISADGVNLILLPATALVYSGYYNNPRVLAAEVKWRVTGSADNFEIVRASFSRRWRPGSLEGNIQRENGLLVARFAPFPYSASTKGTVTLVDGHNKLYRYSVPFQSNNPLGE